MILLDLKQARSDMNLTQVEIAERLDVSVSTWRNYEKDRVEIPEDALKKIKKLMCQRKVSTVKQNKSDNDSESDKIKTYLLTALKDKGADKPVFVDLVDRYINMWETTMKLESDIKMRGVSFQNDRGGWSKNDSVALLVNVNKQMLIILDKLGLNANTIKMEDGGDV